MLIGIPKEIKNHEYRLGINPPLAQALLDAGHSVMVQAGAGELIGFSDELFKDLGADIVKSAKEVYEAEMIIKVKEPLEKEYPLLKEGQILFCFLHLAPQPQLTRALLDAKVIGIAFETVRDKGGKLPLLMPMSAIAGRLSIQIGAHLLQLKEGGKGILLGGVPGVAPAKVVIIGGGVAGTEAAKMALGLGADVTLLNLHQKRLMELNNFFGPSLKTLVSTPKVVEKAVKEADLVIGAALVPGKLAPKVVTKEMVAQMEKGSVIIDIAIDQGGCIETSRITSHSEPTFVEHGVIHYGVSNMPASVARTATDALSFAIMDYAVKIANYGYKKAFQEDEGLLAGLNVALGALTYEAVAKDLGYPFYPPVQFL